MSQLKRALKKLRPLHPGRNRLRNIIAIAVVVAVAGLDMYLLSGSRAASRYTSSGTGGGSLTTPSAGSTCKKPTVIPMDPGNAQSGVTERNYYVTNDTWNAGGYSDLSQELDVCNYNSWYAIATMNDTGDGAVKTSPNVQETWYPAPTKLSRWKSITSQFSDVPPGAGPNYGTWEFEYDVWLNGLADSNSTEVMIWTYNNGQAPNGSSIGPFTDAGRTYMVYYSPPPHQYIAFVATRGSLSGSVNLLHFFNYVISMGWMPASSTLYQICHGVELVSTNGKPEKFTINNFSITMSAYS